MKKSKNDNDEWKGYDEPFGTEINLLGGSGRERLAKHFFDTEMFVYFGEVSSGQCGWGISFVNWLEMKGWEPIGFRRFKKIEPISKKY